MHARSWRPLRLVGALVLIGLLAGCAQVGLEYAPKGPYSYYHKELPAADKAIEAARAAGKNRECPNEFNAAEKLKNDAYAAYWACRTNEAIAMANDATGRANALCPKRAEAPAKPTVTLSANPATVQAGKCTTLTWSSANATGAAIDSGVGAVPPSGSKEVCPKSSTGYGITAKGAGGAATATTVVLVASAPKAESLTLHINFNTNKANIRKDDIPELEKAVEFVKKNPGRKISIEGHTDSDGNAKYNQGLSERRAAAVKDYLLKHGVTGGDRLTTKGYGESKPVADNGTAKGKFLNRRVELIAEP